MRAMPHGFEGEVQDGEGGEVRGLGGVFGRWGGNYVDGARWMRKERRMRRGKGEWY
jgi:hypothetical protein